LQVFVASVKFCRCNWRGGAVPGAR